MKNQYKILFLLLILTTVTVAQTPMQFSGQDCNGNPVDLFSDLDAGMAVVLHFYMPNCGSCPPSAKRIQTMANRINTMYPGKVKGYAFPYQNSTSCAYSSSWVTSNSIGTLYAPMDSGAEHVAYYGGFGMPTVVLLGGKGANRRVMFSTLSFSTSDTTIMRDSIQALLNSFTGLNDNDKHGPQFSIYPNPANDRITFQMDLIEPSLIQIEIMDITGRKVMRLENDKLSGRVTKTYDITNLNPGIYIARVQEKGKFTSHKFNIYH